MLRGVAEGAQLLRQRRSVDPVGIHIKHLAVEEVRQVFGLPVQSRYFSRPLRLLRRWLLAGSGWLWFSGLCCGLLWVGRLLCGRLVPGGLLDGRLLTRRLLA